jgi:tetratricopeptide (TPR) repeat protein
MDEDELRRVIEEHLENAEEFIQQGHRQRALLEFEAAAVKLETEEKIDQLEQLWGHAATGFTAAEAPLQAGTSYLRLAELEARAGRREDARDSYLAAANSFFAVLEKNQELWISLTLNDGSLAIELLYKNANIHHRETGFILDAINSLERAQQLLEKEPNHPLAQEIQEKLQELIDYQS